MKREEEKGRRSMQEVPSSLLLVGAGNMGSAILRGAALSQDPNPLRELSELAIVDPNAEPARALCEDLHRSGIVAQHFSSLSELREKKPSGGQSAFERALLAVKPQHAAPITTALAPLLRDKGQVISIMAGRNIASIKNDLADGAPDTTFEVLRAMPNLPLQVQEGVTLISAPEGTSKAARSFAERLFATGGEVLLVEGEDLLDAGTAVAGSGPGFVFHLISAAIEEAVALGFSPEQARKIVSQTVLGALSLYRQSGESAAELERRVTSPGGTTAAGIQSLQSYQVQRNLRKCLQSAYRRAKELSSGEG